MVVLLPQLPDEELRSCEVCRSVGLRSSCSERTHFNPKVKGKAATWYARMCRGCEADRKRTDEASELARIDRHLEAECHGVPLPDPGERINGRRSGVPFPSATFIKWLEHQRARLRMEGHPDVDQRLSRRLGVSTRTIYRYEAELGADVDDGIVDTAAKAVGQSLWDVASFTEPPPPLPFYGPPRPRECADTHCHERAAYGSRFCPTHRARLTAIRADLKEDSVELAKAGGDHRRGGRSKVGRGQSRPKVPVCCNPYCWNPRVSGHRFCDPCVDEGWSEENYE